MNKDGVPKLTRDFRCSICNDKYKRINDEKKEKKIKEIVDKELLDHNIDPDNIDLSPYNNVINNKDGKDLVPVFDIGTELEKLAKLKVKGLIDEVQFERAKNIIFNSFR